MSWVIKNKEKVLSTMPFTVEKLDFEFKGKLTHPFHRICCPDWVNILPVTKEGKVVLIKQHRAGSLSYVLETPGGMIDPHENEPMGAAARELEEETGYSAEKFISLGAMNPNPAFHDNKSHFFLALGCHFPAERKHFPDPGEDIEVVLTELNEVEELVRQGKVDNVICALCIMLAIKHIPNPN
ncbi:MAG: NUDIX hydrolase [Oligoflexales bacterium]|nr:NUDIX hydrolase [Oligoflexales bacterium]